MAKKLNWKKTITETISAKGTLDNTATILTYKNDDGDDQTIEIQELLNKFASCGIQMTIKMQSDEELDINPEDEYIPDDAVTDIDISDLEE